MPQPEFTQVLRKGGMTGSMRSHNLTFLHLVKKRREKVAGALFCPQAGLAVGTAYKAINPKTQGRDLRGN